MVIYLNNIYKTKILFQIKCYLLFWPSYFVTVFFYIVLLMQNYVFVVRDKKKNLLQADIKVFARHIVARVILNKCLQCAGTNPRVPAE